MADIKKQEKEAKRNLSGDRDQVILEQILKDRKIDHANSHIGGPSDSIPSVYKNPEVKWKPTKKLKVAMVIAPAWGVLFPPYNIAKLTGLLRQDGFSVKVYDANIESYHHLMKTTGEDYWRGERYFYWMFKDNFYNYIFPDLKLLLDTIIDDIIKSTPEVIGFSLYNTNLFASLYMASKIRQALPDCCLLAGGPETITNKDSFKTGREAGGIFNYIFVGESEENLLNLLNNLPKDLPFNTEIGSIVSRLELDKYPYPDYTDYNLNCYLERGISMETSRGCVAQCSFCAETYFWKFRSLSPERIVAEIEHQVKEHNIIRVWFVDSLINGNLKNFRKLVDLLIEKTSHIYWNSYARCDGRMEAEFFRKIKRSGGTTLSFGVESGSQKVLDDMRKKIEIWEIENNLRDCKNAEIFTHVNWIIGFATEEAIDHFHSMQLIYNARQWIDAISPGATAGIAMHSHSETDFKVYGIEGDQFYWDKQFLNQWYTTNYKNTVVHRFIRLKFFHIWLDILTDYKNSIIKNTQSFDNIKEFYSFSFTDNQTVDYVIQDFNVMFNQLGEGLEESIVAEYVGFAYLLSLYFKGIKIKVFFDKEKDLSTFGDYLARNYNSSFEFTVDKKNNFTFKLTHSLEDHFNKTHKFKGNIKDWQTKEPQIRESIHEQYRKR